MNELGMLDFIFFPLCSTRQRLVGSGWWGKNNREEHVGKPLAHYFLLLHCSQLPRFAFNDLRGQKIVAIALVYTYNYVQLVCRAQLHVHVHSQCGNAIPDIARVVEAAPLAVRYFFRLFPLEIVEKKERRIDLMFVFLFSFNVCFMLIYCEITRCKNNRVQRKNPNENVFASSKRIKTHSQRFCLCGKQTTKSICEIGLEM